MIARLSLSIVVGLLFASGIRTAINAATEPQVQAIKDLATDSVPRGDCEQDDSDIGVVDAEC